LSLLLRADFKVFAFRGLGVSQREPPSILSWASTLLQRPHQESSCRPHTLQAGRLAAPPVRFLPLQRFASPGQRPVGRACRAHPPASSGFLNLLTRSSAQNLPALFRAGSAHGVRPSELSSSRAGRSRLRLCYPLAVGKPSPRLVTTAHSRRRSLGSAPTAGHGRGASLEGFLAFRVLLRTRVRYDEPVV
jgi:hypothetical protein